MSSGSGSEPHVDAHHARVAVDHETGADQEDQRHRNFDDDQRAAQSLANAAPASARRLLERVLQVRARDAQSREQPASIPVDTDTANVKSSTAGRIVMSCDGG